MDLGEELNALYTDVLHNRCIFTVKLSKLICHAPKLGIIFYTHYSTPSGPELEHVLNSNTATFCQITFF